MSEDKESPITEEFIAATKETANAIAPLMEGKSLGHCGISIVFFIAKIAQEFPKDIALWFLDDLLGTLKTLREAVEREAK